MSRGRKRTMYLKELRARNH